MATLPFTAERFFMKTEYLPRQRVVQHTEFRRAFPVLRLI